MNDPQRSLTPPDLNPEIILPARMCNELVYCPRLFHLEHVQGLFAESADTIAGSGEHDRAEKRGTIRRQARKKTSSPEANIDPWRGEVPRNLTFESPNWGVRGRLDMIELGEEQAIVVEAKHGSAPATDDHSWGDHSLRYRSWPADVAQVGLYMAILRDLGIRCEEARIYYRGNGIHTHIDWSDGLDHFLRDVVREARRVSCLETPPAPLLDSPKCFGCSLHGICLPDEYHALQASKRPETPIRRIVPGRDDRAFVHITSPGTVLRKRSETLVISGRDGIDERLLLKDISHVAIFGPSQITGQCLQHLLFRGIGISHHTSAGRLVGLTSPLLTRNIGLRRAQYRAADSETSCLTIARALVIAKIRNQRTILKRYRRGAAATVTVQRDEMPAWAAVDSDDDQAQKQEDAAQAEAMATCGAALSQMKRALRSAEKADAIDRLRGHEGEAASAYFTALPSILPQSWRGDFRGRSRRPPRDRVNALLSFAYALLVRDASAAIARIGLDPMLGFFHSMIAGRPALSLDLMEPFRAAWADAAVLRLLATGGIDRLDFHVTNAGVVMSDAGRRALIDAYERRASELTTHPRFGYRMSYRRLLELEARVLGKWLVGEIDEYTPLWTR